MTQQEAPGPITLELPNHDFKWLNPFLPNNNQDFPKLSDRRFPFCISIGFSLHIFHSLAANFLLNQFSYFGLCLFDSKNLCSHPKYDALIL